jgi:hypothetical protein
MILYYKDFIFISILYIANPRAKHLEYSGNFRKKEISIKIIKKFWKRNARILKSGHSKKCPFFKKRGKCLEKGRCD